MATKKNLAFFRRSIVTSLALAALAFVARPPFSVPVLEAQGRQDVEAQNQRLLPLFELAGVVFTDADETRGRLVVGVLDRDIEGLVRARLRVLGIADQSVDVVETEAIFQVATLRDRADAVVGGLQIRFSQFLCSLGFNAIREGVAGFVTAAHCSNKQGGSADGTQYYQPLDQVANDFIGTEIADRAYFRNGVCPKGRRCRYSDANFSRGEGVRSFSLGKIAETTGPNTTGQGSLNVVGEFTITAEAIDGNGADTASVGMTANKVGRTTGWTQGVITGTCVNTGVSGTNIVNLCQNFVESDVQLVAGGDSGSPVFTGNGSNVTLLGNLWGGNGSGTLFVYSPIANVKAELGALSTH